MSYLTQDEETKLAIKYRDTGDIKARNKLIENQFPAIYKCALSMTKDTAVKNELVNVAVLALTDATPKFNPEIGVRYYTWSKLIIRGSMLNHFSGNNNVDISYRRHREYEFDFDSIVAHNEWKQLEREELLYKIIQHIEMLTSEEKQVLHAYLYGHNNNGLTHQLAIAWGLNKTTLKERRRKIIQKLRKSMGEYHDSYNI